MSKKDVIIQAACEVIEEDGIDQFTLEVVAEMAGVSKVGLLYHFASKDALIEALNEFAATDFRNMLLDYVGKGLTYHEAYVCATRQNIRAKRDVTNYKLFVSSLVVEPRFVAYLAG